MRFTKSVGTATAALLFAATASFSQAPTTPAPAKPKSSAAAKPVASAATATYDRALLKPALLKDQAPETYQVQFETTRGAFTISVTRAWSPLGAARFYNLVKHHYYDTARVSRVVPGFVAQFGISAYPPVTKAWRDAKI